MLEHFLVKRGKKTLVNLPSLTAQVKKLAIKLYSLDYILAVERIIHQKFFASSPTEGISCCGVAPEVTLVTQREHELSCGQQGKVRLIAAYTQTGRPGLRSKNTEDTAFSKILRRDHS